MHSRRAKEVGFGVLIISVVIVHMLVHDRANSWRIPVWKEGVRVFYTYRRDPDAAVEYRLPCEHLPAETRSRLHPWLKSFVGASEEEAKTLLAQRWEQAPEFLHPLRDRLLREFRPCTILVRGEECFLGVYRDDADFDGMFVPPPPQAAKVDEITRQFSPNARDSIAAFLHHFGGLRESVPPTSGDFVYDQTYSFADEEYPVHGGSRECASWLIFYHALNGDSLLISPSGELAWYRLGTYSFHRLRVDIESLPKHFADYKYDTYPFDSHGRHD